MKRRQPLFWAYQKDPFAREAAPLTRALLSPFSTLYGMGYAVKQRCVAPRSVPAFVICVGNLTVGGAGKTPIVRYLRSVMSEAGYRVASLSRGYGGRISDPIQIDPSKHTAKDVGDEPLMLAQHGESWIGRNRYMAAKAMSEAGIDIIVMDDGFQNPSLKKDYNLIVFDGLDPVGNGALIPKGPLREPVESGLDRADGALIMAGDTDIDVPNLPRLKTIFWDRNIPFANLSINATRPEETSPWVAFAGIGKPDKFFRTLSDLDMTVKDMVSYSDHYAYKPEDLRFLHKLAEEYAAKLITTEKDWMRLSDTHKQNITYLPISLNSNPAFDAIIADILTKIRAFRER